MRKRLPTIILAILGIAVVVLFYKYGIMKNKSAIQELKERHAAYTDSVNTARTVAERLDEMKRRVRVAELQWEKATEMLPKEKEIPDLLTSITQMGTRNNVVFRLFQPTPIRREDIYMALPIKVAVFADYHDLGGFLSAVASLPRIVNVSDLRISRGGEEGSVTADFVATTYLLSEEKMRVATRKGKPGGRRPR
ncbi:MAG: type 4a pilus biogenesis protein PilO [bacterium]